MLYNLTMLKKNETLRNINSAGAGSRQQEQAAGSSSAQLSSAQLSSSITLNFFQVYVYLLIIKTIIFILSSYLIKSFIYINYYLVILHTNKYYYLIPAV